MPTIKQLSLNSRKPKKNVTRSPALIGCPQRRGTCIRVYVRLGKLITNNNNNLITVNCYITYG